MYNKTGAWQNQFMPMDRAEKIGSSRVRAKIFSARAWSKSKFSLKRRSQARRLQLGSFEPALARLEPELFRAEPNSNPVLLVGNILPAIIFVFCCQDFGTGPEVAGYLEQVRSNGDAYLRVHGIAFTSIITDQLSCGELAVGSQDWPVIVQSWMLWD